MAGLAQLIIDLSVNSAKFVSGINEANRSLNTMKRGVETIKWASLTYMAREALNAVQQFYAFGKSIAFSTNEIQRQAGVVGISSQEWQKWTYAAKMADVSTEGLMNSWKFLSRSLIEAKDENSDAGKALKALGITANSTEELMFKLADRFHNAADGAEKIDYAVRLAGRGAMEVIPLWNKGSQAIKELQQEAVTLGTVLGDVIVKKGSEAEDIFKRLDAKINATKLSLAPLVLEFANLAEAISKSIKQMEKWTSLQKTPENVPPYVENFLRNFGLDFLIPGLESKVDEMRRKAMEEFQKREWPSEARFKAPKVPLPSSKDEEKAQKQLQLDLEYQAKYLNLVGGRLTALETERKRAIEEATEKGLKTYEIEKYYTQLKTKLQNEFLQEIAITAAQVSAEAAKLSDLGQMEDWRESLEVIPAGFMKWNDALIKIADYEALAAEGLGVINENMKEYKTLLNEGVIPGMFQFLDRLREINRARSEGQGYEVPTPEQTGEMDVRSKWLDVSQRQNMAQLNAQIATYTGNWKAAKDAEIELLRIEKERRFETEQLTNDQKKLIEQESNLREVRLLAERDMDRMVLGQQGILDAQIRVNRELVDAYRNVIPSAIETTVDAFSTMMDGLTDKTKKKTEVIKQFFLDMGKGIQKTLTDIGKKELEVSILNKLAPGAAEKLGIGPKPTGAVGSPFHVLVDNLPGGIIGGMQPKGTNIPYLKPAIESEGLTGRGESYDELADYGETLKKKNEELNDDLLGPISRRYFEETSFIKKMGIEIGNVFGSIRKTIAGIFSSAPNNITSPIVTPANLTTISTVPEQGTPEYYKGIFLPEMEAMRDESERLSQDIVGPIQDRYSKESDLIDKMGNETAGAFNQIFTTIGNGANSLIKSLSSMFSSSGGGGGASGIASMLGSIGGSGGGAANTNPAGVGGFASYYDSGGIAKGPTTVNVGPIEEAFVPLSGGRKIPVETRGGDQGRAPTIVNIGTYVERVDTTDVKSFERKYGSAIVGINREHNRKQTSRRGTV